MEEHAISFFDTQSDAGLKHAVEETGQVITLSEEEAERWKEKIAFIIDEYAEELNSRGLPGTEAKGLVFELGENIMKFKVINNFCVRNYVWEYASRFPRRIIIFGWRHSIVMIKSVSLLKMSAKNLIPWLQ